MEKIKIKQMPTITTDDIEKLTGIHWTEFEFTDCVENDSYVLLVCDEEEKAALEEDLMWELGKSERRVRNIKNQLKLIEILNTEYNITDGILVFVCW